MPEVRDWMIVGEIAGPFGLHGEIKVEPLTDYPERFDHLETVYLGTTHRPYTVLRSRFHKSHVLLTLEGVETPEQIDMLRREDVQIPREEAVELPEGHYFLEDIIGAEVVTSVGHPVGRITDIIRTGGNDVYVVNEGPAAVLVPVVKDAVTSLDVAGKRVVIEPWVLNSDEP